MEEEYDNVSNDLLLRFWNTQEDIIIILLDGTIITTDNDELIGEYEASGKIECVIFTSDFMIMFPIKAELERRGLI